MGNASPFSILHCPFSIFHSPKRQTPAAPEGPQGLMAGAGRRKNLAGDGASRRLRPSPGRAVALFGRGFPVSTDTALRIRAGDADLTRRLEIFWVWTAAGGSDERRQAHAASAGSGGPARGCRPAGSSTSFFRVVGPKRTPPVGSEDSTGGGAITSRRRSLAVTSEASRTLRVLPRNAGRRMRFPSHRRPGRRSDRSDRTRRWDSGRPTRTCRARTTGAGALRSHRPLPPAIATIKVTEKRRPSGGECRRKDGRLPPDIRMGCFLWGRIPESPREGGMSAPRDGRRSTQLTREPGATGLATVTTTTSRSSGPGLPSASAAGSALRSLAARIMP